MTDTQAASALGSSGSAVSNERIGGGSSVRTAVGLFYERVLAVSELAGYFTDVYQRLGIPVRHCRRVGDHLSDTWRQLDVRVDVLGDVRGVLKQATGQLVALNAMGV